MGFVDPDELHQGLDSKVGERHDAVFFDAIDPDETVLGVYFIGDVSQPISLLPEILGDARNGDDVMDFVDGHGQAARAGIADAGDVQFQGNNSSSR